MKLLIKIPGHKDQEIPLKNGTSILGRGKESDIPVIHTGVSRAHIQFDCSQGKVFVTDLGSSNGSKLGTKDLVAKEKVEFTPFFPLVLAKEVEISLLPSDHLGPMGTPSNIDIRQEIRPNDEKTKKIGPRRLESLEKSNNNKMIPVVLVVVAILVILVYLLKPELFGL